MRIPGRRIRAAFLALGTLTASVRAQENAPSARGLAETHEILDEAQWNDRIDALYDLGDLGDGELRELAFAGSDADWQVRLTAVHFLGKMGPSAAPVLGEIALREPCPHVRRLALLSLLRLGPASSPLFRAAATPEDEAALRHLPARYSPESMGKPLVIDAPDEMNADFYNGGPDFRVCASSERSGHPHLKQASNPAAPVVTPDVPLSARKDLSSAPSAPADSVKAAVRSDPERRRRDREIDALLASTGTPEFLPPGLPAPASKALSASAGPRPEFPERGTLALSSVPPAGEGRESFPPGAPAPEPRAPEAAAAEFVPDAGTGKPAVDPIPDLIGQLSSPDFRRRARAADELGKRGAASARAVPALRRALRDRNRRVRASAVLALGSAGRGVEGVLSDLKRASRDKDEDVRFSASIALERIARTRE